MTQDSLKFGDFLKACRRRTPPPAGGMPARRRRTPGLRREEVAQLAGVSVTWYTWLEQGRPVRASPAVLSRLSRALQLSEAEEAYLYHLSGLEHPAAAGPGVSPALLQAVVDACGGNPAIVLGPTWDFLAWNRAACEILGDLSPLQGLERNNLGFMLLNPEIRRRTPEWEDRVRTLIAEFRSDCSRHLGSPDFVRLVADLERASPLFGEAWHAQEVSTRAPREKAYRVPGRGLCVFEQVSFLLMQRTDVKLVLYLPRISAAG